MMPLALPPKPLAEPDAENSPRMRLLETCPSTLSHAADLLQHGELAEWDAVLAGSQTAGRGQLGRTWVSPPGNLYVTVRLPSTAPFDGTAAAPALGGLLATALRSLDLPILVKWPNDLVLSCPPSDTARLRKVGGILIEERHGGVLAGIGLNIAHAPADDALRRDAALPAGRLAEEHLRDLGIKSMGELWTRLCFLLRNTSEHKDFSNQWRKLLEPLLAFHGQNVVVRDSDEYRGRLLGVDEQGGLRLRTTTGEVAFFSGSLQIPGEHLE